jgi:enoyl-CoA hydratase/carnithine racemase
VPDGQVEEEARKMAREIIDRVSPQAFRIMKSGLRYWTDLAMLTWPWAKNMTSATWTTQEFRERAREFLEKKEMKPRKFMRTIPD